MQHRPDAPTLLSGVAEFLLGELLPRVEDKALAFKVMIAANLCAVVAGELRTEDARFTVEFARLRALLPGVDVETPTTREGRSAVLQKLDAELARRLRENRFSEEELQRVAEHVRVTALETLAHANPRFDTAEDVD